MNKLLRWTRRSDESLFLEVYEADRDVAAAQVVVQRGLAAVGHTVKMLSEGKATRLPVMKESPSL